MSAHMLHIQVDAANVDAAQATEEVSVRRNMQNDTGMISVTDAAETLGSVLATLRPRFTAAIVDDIVYAFRRGYTGERG